MPEELSSFDFPVRSSKYPWQEWLDGRIRKFTKGVDFPGSPEGFRISALCAGRRMKVRVRTTLLGTNSVVVQRIS